MRASFQTLIALILCCVSTFGQTISQHAEGLKEELIEVDIDGGIQRAVLSHLSDSDSASKLIVLLPGYPSVVRPEMDNGVMVNSSLIGNFLIRARRHVISNQTMTLLVDCHTSIGDVCNPDYQASEQRYKHVLSVINIAKMKYPNIKQVYLLSTSMGTISSAFMAKFGQNEFSGVIYTATIDPTAPKSYSQLSAISYSDIKIPQAFVHHIEDPCSIAQYGYIRSIAEKNNIPLVTVSGGNDFKGQPCQAFTQHGFRNRESLVMNHVLKMLNSSTWVSEELK